MKKKYDLIIFDIYLIYHACFEAQTLKTFVYQGKEYPIQGVIGSLELIDKTIKKYGTDKTKAYFLFDNAKTSVLKHRKDLSPNYKANRPVMSQAFYRMLDALELILKAYRDNSYIYRVTHLEADDFVHNIINHYTTKDDKILMVSNDMDWCRSLDNNVEQLRNGRVYTVDDFKKQYEFDPTFFNIVMYKAFYGDNSDNIIPAIPQLPMVYFRDFIKYSNSIYQFLQKMNEGFFDAFLDNNWKKRINLEREKLILNYKLADSPNFEDIELKQWCFDCNFIPEKLKILYGLYHVEGVDKRIKFDDTKKEFHDEWFRNSEMKRK